MFYMIHTENGKLNIGGSGFDMEALLPGTGHPSRSGSGLLSESLFPEDSLLCRVPERFTSEDPFHLLFITCREEEASSSMILMQASPDRMLYLSGKISPGNLQLLNRRRLHRHDYYELMYVIEGNIYQNIEHSRHYYTAGSCCLLNPRVYHMEEMTGDQRIVFLGLNRDFLESMIRSERYFSAENSEALRNLAAFLRLEDASSEFSGKASMDFIPLESGDWVRTQIHDGIDRILRIIQQPESGDSLRVRSLILRILCLLFDSSHYRHTPIPFASTREEQLFSEITGYLKEHRGRTGRQELVSRFHYSGDYLYKTVRKFTGLSLGDYAAKIVLAEAARELTETDISVTELIGRHGFSNQTSFYRRFREEYGMSPKEYRKKTKAP